MENKRRIRNFFHQCRRFGKSAEFQILSILVEVLLCEILRIERLNELFQIKTVENGLRPGRMTGKSGRLLASKNGLVVDFFNVVEAIS